MDATAISLCKDNQLPIIVYNLRQKGNLRRIVMGEKVGTMVKEYVDDRSRNLDRRRQAAHAHLAWRRCGASWPPCAPAAPSLSMLDNIRVDYYGTPTPLNQVGNLSTPGPHADHGPALGRRAPAARSRRRSARRTSTSTRRTTARSSASRSRRSPRSGARSWSSTRTSTPRRAAWPSATCAATSTTT